MVGAKDFGDAVETGVGTSDIVAFERAQVDGLAGGPVGKEGGAEAQGRRPFLFRK